MAFNESTPSYLHKGSIRDAAVLTNSYIETTAISNDLSEFNQIIIEYDFTIGSLNFVDIKVETGDSINDVFQTVNVTQASGITTVTHNTFRLSATGRGAIPIPIIGRFLKISVIGDGTVTSSSLALNLAVGVR